MKNYIPSTYLIYCCRSFEVWVRAVWVWGRSEISWPLAQTSWPGSLRPSSWDSLYLDREISISIRLCGQTFGRSQRNSHLNQLKHKKMLSSMKVIYLTLTSCSFPILYYTSIESNMERMWWTVERIFREKLKIEFWRFYPKRISPVVAPLRHHPRPCIQFLLIPMPQCFNSWSDIIYTAWGNPYNKCNKQQTNRIDKQANRSN